MEWVFILPSIAILVTAGVTGVGLGLVGAGLNPILLAGVTVLGALGGAAVSFGLLLLAESRGPGSEVLAVAEGLVLTIVVPIVTTALGILLLARLMVAVRDWATTEAGLHPAVVTVGALFLAVAAVAMAVGLVQRLAREPTVESLTRGLGRHPADPDRLSDRASLYVKQGELELAATDYTRAIELEPFNLSDLLLARARLYAQQGRLGDAIADLTRTIELERDSTAALRDRAQLYAQRGDFDLAIGDASIVVEREVAPVHRASAHVERGRIFADRGDLELAIADYTRAIEISSPFEVCIGPRGRAPTGDGARLRGQYRRRLLVALRVARRGEGERR